MKSIAIAVFVAAFFVAPLAAMAKTEKLTGSTDTQVTNTLAGPPEAARKDTRTVDTAQPSKAELKKTKIKPKPPLQDPN